MGRGKLDDLLSAEEFETIFSKLHDLSRRAPFHIKTTEAQHYRRYILQQQTAERRNGKAGLAEVSPKVQDTVGRAPRGLNDGKGFAFISHVGQVFPSGFLPVSGGNVRSEPLRRIYRESQIFRQLRDPDQLKGKCGVCEFRYICGGSRGHLPWPGIRKQRSRAVLTFLDVILSTKRTATGWPTKFPSD